MQKILLLEDDLNLNRGIALLLSREGYEVRQVYTIKEAKEAFQKGDYALVISDITLPDGTGLDFGRMVRAGGDTYLIYLTALDQEIDIVNGYDTGADDYITKPFSLMALVSKVNALMRRLYKCFHRRCFHFPLNRTQMVGTDIHQFSQSLLRNSCLFPVPADCLSHSFHTHTSSFQYSLTLKALVM